MNVRINKGVPGGRVNAPPSKSMAHRMLISAAMASGTSRIRGISDCEDVRATIDCLVALGVQIEQSGNDVTVTGVDMTASAPRSALNCNESGSTLRFLLPIALLSGKNTLFMGAEGLMKRPMNVYEELCKKKGLSYNADGESIAVRGPLPAGEFEVVGNVSSQFISGLLFALPCLPTDSKIKIIPPIESRSYIDLTIEALALFGVEVKWSDDTTLYVKGGQKYRPADLTVEGDYSGAAFIDSFSLFGRDVSVDGLNPDSTQGDKVYKLLFDMIKRGVPTIHIGNCPDLGPILFAAAAAKHGAVFTGTKRLKIKESDRAAAMAEELSKFGVSVTVYEDKVVVYPISFHAPSETLCGHNDHRIVMALAVLLTLTGGEITGAEAINKSYPSFFEDLRALGIEVTEYEA
ncbi:MAG: 3-phosphoshikimate 1-carboxyvinyltransferase [Clostridia bacterium]|nr:3-phosphoshikimate 1-carboxyvinyltransferase [Clostridia bacterium]